MDKKIKNRKKQYVTRADLTINKNCAPDYRLDDRDTDKKKENESYEIDSNWYFTWNRSR